MAFASSLFKPVGRAAPCALLALFLMILSGCDPNAKNGKGAKEEEEPEASPWQRLSQLNAPKKGKIDEDANLSAEELHSKHLTKIKEMQAKALKEQEEAIKKAEKKNKKNNDSDKKDNQNDDPLAGRAIASGGRELLQFEPPKNLKDKQQPVRITKSDGNLSTNKSVIELPGAAKSKQRTGANTFSNGDDNGGKAVERGGIAAANKATSREKSLIQ